MAITLDGITFSGDMSGQKALAAHRKKYYTRVVTGYKDAYNRKYTGPPKAGGQGWVNEKIQQPQYGYIRNQTALPAPKPKPAPPAPQPYTPKEIQGLISDTIAKATPAPAPAPPPPPPAQIMFSSPTLVGQSPLQLSPASTTPTKVSPFQRRSSSANLKINQSLNV